MSPIYIANLVYTSINKSSKYLDSLLLQVNLARQILSQHHVRIMCLPKSALQLIQLLLTKNCPVASLSLRLLLLLLLIMLINIVIAIIQINKILVIILAKRVYARLELMLHIAAAAAAAACVGCGAAPHCLVKESLGLEESLISIIGIMLLLLGC